jgi:hypothetical protein
MGLCDFPLSFAVLAKVISLFWFCSSSVFCYVSISNTQYFFCQRYMIFARVVAGGPGPTVHRIQFRDATENSKSLCYQIDLLTGKYQFLCTSSNNIAGARTNTKLVLYKLMY